LILKKSKKKIILKMEQDKQETEFAHKRKHIKKMIDEKGKFFGKINIIDLAIIIVIILMMVWGVNKLLSSEGEPSTIYIQLQVCENKGKGCGNVPSYYFDTITKGEKLFSNNQIIGKIIDKYGLEKTEDSSDTPRVDIRLILKLKVLDKNGIFLFNDKPIKLKEILDINTGKTTISGVIRNFDKNLSSTKLEYHEKDVGIYLADQPVEIISNIKKGDKELGSGNETIAEITNYQTYSTTSPNKNIVLKADLKTLFLDNSYWFKGRKLKVGEGISIETDKIILRGTIISLDKARTTTFKKAATIKLYNQPEYIADKIIVGDQEQDNKGGTIGEILSKKVENAQREITTEGGSLVLVESHLNKDITLEVLLTVEKKQDELFFHGDNLKIGKSIYLSLEEIDISGKIVDLG
jgi:hypothetical protein